MSVKRLATLIVAVVMLGALIPASALAASTTNNGSCPSNTAFKVDPTVGATWTASGGTATYTFTSFVNEHPVNDVPGLVGYCVYPSTPPSSVAKLYDSWTATLLKGTKGFVFARPNGADKNNVPLDGTGPTQIGSATWNGGTVPTNQTILLHVYDAAQCAALYGGLSPATCWVLPGTQPGPICNAGTGNTAAAYNSMPTDVEHCGPPAEAFQGQSVSEFGDLVNLDTAAGTTLDSMSVDFQSYACQTGGWNTGDCVSAPGSTWTIPDSAGQPGSGGVTANIYEVGAGNSVGPLIATAHADPAFPYRPSAVADSTCPNAVTPGNPVDSRYPDAVFGTCRYSIYKNVTFTSWSFPNGAHPFTNGEQVIWTVAFNTQSYGAFPIGSDGPWNSLNVGTKTYYSGTTPFAGSDEQPGGVVLNSSWDGAYCDSGAGGHILRLDASPPECTNTTYFDSTGWLGLTPLATIVTK